MIRFLYENIFASATLTSSTETSGYADDNVLDNFPSQKWRSTDRDDQWLKFNLGSAQEVTMFTAIRNNLTSTAVLKLYGHATNLGDNAAAWAGATYSGTLSFDQNVGIVFPNNTLQWWFLEIDDPSNADNFVEVGLIYGGAYQSPSENFNEDFMEKTCDSSLQNWSEGGHGFSVEKPTWKEFQIQFADIDSDNRTVLKTMWDAVGRREPLVIALDPDLYPVEFTRFGKFMNEALEFQGMAYDRFSTSLYFREVR